MGKTSKIITLTLISFVLASGSFAVFVQAQNQAIIGIVPTAIPSILEIIGQGFGPSENVIVTVNDPVNGAAITTLIQVATDGEGNFVVDLNFYANPAIHTLSGQYIITATSPTTQAAAPYSFVPLPTVTPSPSAPTLQASPDNSNIMSITGSGLDVTAPVTLTLVDSNGTTAYTVNQQITTNSGGSFSATIIIPTIINGTFTLKASTNTASATTQVTIPNLVGPTGPAGLKGETGTTGQTGANGNTDTAGSDSTLAYVSLAVSVAALAVAALQQ